MADTFTPIAICGYSCKLPGDATDAEGLWRMCVEGRNAWSTIPETRFSPETFYHDVQGEPGTTTVAGGHFLRDDIYAFDASFFNMSVETAKSMDPAVRLQLESVFEAFEQGGMTLDDVAGSKTSVFSGSFHRDYHDSLSRNPDSLPRFLLTGTGTAMLSNRISHFFDLRGPSMTIDTGCSSSLTSLHTACRSLQAKDCDMSIVTGCNILLNPDPFISMSGLGLLSPSGRSYAFDKRAEGYGRGEGVATLVLKTLTKAKVDGDTIHAVIRGSASNQDGKTATLTSPNQEAQAALIADCYRVAGLDPRDTAFVECHGTGTQVGDLCEASAIRTSFITDSRHFPLYLGSVKSNIGHLEAASGLASIIKVIKAFQNDKIPPNHDFTNPSPTIPWNEWHLAVAREAVSWPSGFTKRASVNSFGYGGANAHIILEAPEANTTRTNRNVNGTNHIGSALDLTKGHMFLLSSNDTSGCALAMSKLRTYVENLRTGSVIHETRMLSTISYKLAYKRTHFKWRTVVHASSGIELENALASKEASPILSTVEPSIGFVFTGQGAHWAGMGKELIEIFPKFHEALQQLDQCLVSLGASWSIIDELRRDSSTSRLEQAKYSMPVCCALQIALVILLRSWNIFPSAVSGHSSGESAAAFAAGALDMRSALAIQYYRGLLSSLSTTEPAVKGGMLAVGLDPEEAQRRVEGITSGKVVIGCYNSPSSVTLSGDEAGIVELEESIKADGHFARKLKVQNAFHSNHMKRDAAEYKQLLESSLSTEKRAMNVPLASSVTGTWLTKSDDFGPNHWMDYMLLPVQFTKASTKLLTETAVCDSQHTNQSAVNIIVEIGPHSALLSPLRQTMKSLKITDVSYITILKRSESALTSARDAVGFLWSHGYPVDLSTIIVEPRHDDLLAINLPAYTWNHKTSLSIQHPSEVAFRHRSHQKNALIGTVQPTSNPTAPSWQRTCSIGGQSWPHELTIDNVSLPPQPLFLSMAFAAFQQLAAGLGCWQHDQRSSSISLEEVHFNTDAVFIQPSATGLLRTSLHETRKPGEESAGLIRGFQIHCIQNPNQWALLCEGQITLHTKPEVWPVHIADSLTDPSLTGWAEIRPGALRNIPNQKFVGENKIPPIITAHLNTSPDSVNVLFQGQWVDASIRAPQGDTVTGSLRLASVFQSLTTSRHIYLAGKAKQVPVFIKRATIDTNVSSGASSLYRSYVQTSKQGELSVAWSQLSDANENTTASTEKIYIQGIKFDSDWNCIDEVYASSLCHSLINAANETMDEIPRHFLGDEERGVLLDLNTLCRAFFHQTLTALRKDPPRRLLGHFSSYVQFMKSIESMSTSESGRLTQEEIAALRARVISSSVNGQLICTVGDQLVPLIRGEVDPLEVMMKDRLLHRYYEEGLRWTRSYEQLQVLIKKLSTECPRMNILEIGAGTGGATTSVLQALETGEKSAEDLRCESYTYTDISAGFFSKAREKFSRYAHVMTFKKLDIEKDLRGQALAGETYDLIVASQCLHATGNMRNTMANVRRLLKSDGRLVMVETTKDSLDIQLFASCFRGWWLSEEPERKWSPSLSEGLWQQVLTESGFSGIDFTIRDCEDEELYAMQVILSTAVNQVDHPTKPLKDELHVVTMCKNQSSLVARAIQDEMGTLYTVRATVTADLDQEMDDAIYLVFGADSWLGSDIKAMTKKISRCRGAVLITTRHNDSGFQGKGSCDIINSLRSLYPNLSIVSFAIDSTLDIFGESVVLALSNLLKLGPDRRDNNYSLTPNQLKTSRAIPFSRVLEQENKSISHSTLSVKADEQYVIRGSSVGLISAGCELVASRGAHSIWAVLDATNGDYQSDLETMQLLAKTLSETKGCQIIATTCGAKPEFNGKVAGIIDFGDVKENIDLRTIHRRPSVSAPMTPLESGSVGELDFHIKFAPLFDLLSPAWAPPQLVGTTIYTGSVATADEFALEVQMQGSQPVEMSSILILLAELLGRPNRGLGETLFIGLPKSLNVEERELLVANPQFRSLSLRARPQQKAVDPESGLNRAGVTFQISPTMSKQEICDVVCGGIVNYIAEMFMLSETEVDEKGPLSQYIDSLTATQLRDWLFATFRVALTGDDISNSLSIRGLADRVASRWKPSA
ncbi:hypothetical protein F5B21DRAFT_529187 [Xylaria acuta]|nr:hypothetical protein F5B21DRAFT_529187 [Xylaria acuta]